MKKELSKVVLAFLAMALAVFASCDNGTGTGDTEGNPGENSGANVDVENHQGTGAAFRVRNDTNYTLVAFRNSVAHTNLLGGIPALAQNHGIVI